MSTTSMPRTAPSPPPATAFFILNLAVCYLIAYIGAKKLVSLFLASSALTKKTQENIALLIGMIFYTILNYIGQKIFVFGKKREKADDAFSAIESEDEENV